MTEIATRSTWKNYPMDNPKRIKTVLHFTEQQFSKLKMGLIPEEMEDKWFIFYENSWLYFHRSWTGFGLYKAEVIKEQDGYSIQEFWAERNQEKYTNEDDTDDIQTFSFLIARGLLGIDVSHVYSNQNIKSEADAVKGWSNFGNMLVTHQGIDYSNAIKSMLFGVAVGMLLACRLSLKTEKLLAKVP